MKTRSILLLALPISLLLSACGMREPPPSPSSPPADSSPLPPAESAPHPSAAGPAGLPPCLGLLSVEKTTGDAGTGASILISSQPLPRLLDAYAADLAADGWTLKTSLQQADQHHLLFLRSGRFLRLQIGPAAHPPALSRLLLAWGLSAGADADRDAFEPDSEEEASAPDEVPPE